MTTRHIKVLCCVDYFLPGYAGGGPIRTIANMRKLLAAFDDIPDPRASNVRHDLGEILVIAFVPVLYGSASCAEMAAFGRAKESIFRSVLKLKHAIPSHDTFSGVFRMIDPKALASAYAKRSDSKSQKLTMFRKIAKYKFALAISRQVCAQNDTEDRPRGTT